MKILPYCYVMLFLSILLPGCYQNKKPTGNVHVQDLMPQNPVSDSNTSAVGLYVYVFQFDKENYPAMFDGLGEVNNFTIKYNDAGSFAANGFICDGGDRGAWAKLAQVLTNAQAKLTKRTIAYINFNTDEDIIIAEQPEPVSVSYRSAGGASAGIGLPPGTIALRVNATSLIGPKQICRLSITPVYKAKTASDETLKEQKIHAGDFVFDSASVNVPLRPGQFVFIAPDTGFPKGPLPAVGQMMFCSPQGRPFVSFCLIACGLIND